MLANNGLQHEGVAVPDNIDTVQNARQAARLTRSVLFGDRTLKSLSLNDLDWFRDTVTKYFNNPNCKDSLVPILQGGLQAADLELRDRQQNTIAM